MQIKDAFVLGMTSVDNTCVSKQSVHFQICCSSFSVLF